MGSETSHRGRRESLTGSPSLDASESLRWTLVTGAACNGARLTQTNGTWGIVGDPTEGAMLVGATKGGVDVDGLAASMPRVAAIPFSSDRQYMATLHQPDPDGALIVLVKGAVERVTELCGTEMTAEGSTRDIDHGAVTVAVEDLAGELVFTGLQTMLDPTRPAPPRAAAAAAVRWCHAAGIDVKMITGDHAATAAIATAIAEQLGLLGARQPGDVLTGPNPPPKQRFLHEATIPPTRR